MSSSSIDPGARWSSELSAALRDLQFGIICLTPDNLNEPWIHFEAGALSKTIVESYVVPYLFSFPPTQLSGPLAQFQAVQADRPGTLKLVELINSALGGMEWGSASDGKLGAVPVNDETTKIARNSE